MWQAFLKNSNFKMLWTAILLSGIASDHENSYVDKEYFAVSRRDEMDGDSPIPDSQQA